MLSAAAVTDDRNLRLCDLQPDETVRVYCRCGCIAEWMQAFIHRTLLKRVRLETPIANLARRLRCEQCGAKAVVKITIFDENCRYDNSKPDRERVIVGGPPIRRQPESLNSQLCRKPK
jgi:hypothetical protein